MHLLIMLGRRALPPEELAQLLGQPTEKVETLLASAYRRQVLERDPADRGTVYRAGCFYNRLDNFCKFGNYYVLPVERGSSWTSGALRNT